MKHIPVVALPANAMPHDVERELAAGFFDSLIEPSKINELMTALDVASLFQRRFIRVRIIYFKPNIFPGTAHDH